MKEPKNQQKEAERFADKLLQFIESNYLSRRNQVMGKTLTDLQKAHLRSKGLSDEILAKFTELKIDSKEGLAAVGTAQTLVEMTGMSLETAKTVLEWAGTSAANTGRVEDV